MVEIAVVLFSLFAICVVIGLLLINKDVEVSTLFVAAGLGFFGSFILVSGLSDSNPTAMDVYKGKTSLEYTVVDGVKVDSCVIFKKE